MKTIYKYPLAVTDEQIVDLPGQAVPLSVQVQHGTPCLWAMVDTDLRSEKLIVRTFGSVHPLPSWAGEYAGTYQLDGGALVFHVFFEWRLKTEEAADAAQS